MLMYTDEELLDKLNEQNPWWVTDDVVLDDDIIERELESEIKDELDERIITAIIGLRRTGKTTLLKQQIKRLLTDKKSKYILYFSFDAMEKQDKAIRKIFQLYHQHILKEVPSEFEERVFIFFDEVQKVKDWGEEIKSIWDRGYPVKFIVSGSSSMNILKGGGESLVGRISLHRLYPFSFAEFLKYYGVQADRLSCHDILEDEIKYPVYSGKIQVKFQEYLKTGGFPEILTKDKKKDYLNDIVSLTFYRDIVTMLPVKRTEVLEGLFYHFIRESGQVINYNKLADSLNTKYETVKDYIDHLESSFLIERSTLYSKNKLKSIRKNPKIYVADHGFSILEKMEKGLRVETAVYNHITRYHDVYYWKDRKELDLVVETKQKPIPIEVKFKEQIGKKDIKGLMDFMKKTDVEKGVVVNKKDYRTETADGKQIVYVPAWLFLLSEW